MLSAFSIEFISLAGCATVVRAAHHHVFCKPQPKGWGSWRCVAFFVKADAALRPW